MTFAQCSQWYCVLPTAFAVLAGSCVKGSHRFRRACLYVTTNTRSWEKSGPFRPLSNGTRKSLGCCPRARTQTYFAQSHHLETLDRSFLSTKLELWPPPLPLLLCAGTSGRTTSDVWAGSGPCSVETISVRWGVSSQSPTETMQELQENKENNCPWKPIAVAQAAITKYQYHLLPQSSGDWKPMVKVPSGLVSGERVWLCLFLFW